MTGLGANVPAGASSALTPEPPHGADAPAVVAFYLPQYHQIPENDEWWGQGFTDWVNVAAARPLYPGHPVPHVPSELGEYDLRSRDVRAGQAELAREHGVYGFCYYFYWFGGRRLLETPLKMMLADGEPSLPFCLCWANEPWTRRWDGRDRDILMPQRHDRVRDLTILDDLTPYFEDERYIRIDGRPLLLIYRQSLLDEPARFAADLRQDAVRRGLPGLYLCNVMSIGDTDRVAKGFDAAVEFPPNGTLGREIKPRSLGADPAFKGKIYDYASVVETMLARPILPFRCFPGVMPRWDNSARKGMAAHVFHGSAPELFERWLRRAGHMTVTKNPRSPLLFVNSWNEWAEGAQLEPDQRFGHQYLQVIRDEVAADLQPLALANRSHRPDPLPAAWRDSNGDPPDAPVGSPLHHGLPAGVAELSPSDAECWIDEVGGRRFRGRVMQVDSGTLVWVRAWCDRGSKKQRLARSFARGPVYLVLSAGDATLHTTLVERAHDIDSLRGFLAHNTLRRKLIRAMDRVPDSLSRHLLRLWVRRSDVHVFDARFDISDVPSGRWEVRVLHVSDGDARMMTTGISMEISR